MPNDLAFVTCVVNMLGRNGIEVRLFGGWAEELRGLASPRQHGDSELLFFGSDFDPVDVLIRSAPLEEIRAKRFPHKRAFVTDGVVVEMFLVERDASEQCTNFWGRTRLDWPEDSSSTVRGLPVVEVEGLRAYREQHARIRMDG